MARVTSAYDADRVFGIIVRIRACLGIALGVVLMGVCAMAGSAAPPRSNDFVVTGSDGKRVDPQTEETMRAVAGARNPPPPNPAAAMSAILGVVTLVTLGISAFEYILGGWIGGGERRGFVAGTAAEGISCVLGLFNVASNPLAIIGFLLSFVTFAYCIARLNGTGPKPV